MRGSCRKWKSLVDGEVLCGGGCGVSWCFLRRCGKPLSVLLSPYFPPPSWGYTAGEGRQMEVWIKEEEDEEKGKGEG